MKILFKWIGGRGFPCLFHLFTGLYCPGCGGTRAVGALLKGKFGLSLRCHPLVLYTAAVAAAELASLTLSRIFKKPRWYLGHERLFANIGAGIVAVNWIYKNVMLVFFDIDLLSPRP